MTAPLMRQVKIRNYKSIAACDVTLGPLMFMVGPNGAGKSNFLDALRFLSDSLRDSLYHALRARGAIKEVRRRSGGHPNHFALRYTFTLPSGQAGHYAFRIGAKQNGGYEVQDEECVVHSENPLAPDHFFKIRSGAIVESSVQMLPAVVSDRLFLVNAAGLPEFRPVFDALSRIEVYNLNPNVIASMQNPDSSELLRRDGGNAASVFHQLPDNIRIMINKNLSRIVPGITEAEAKTFGSQETIEFRQAVKGQTHSWKFLASAMSDGILRAFGILLAVFQAASNRNGVPLLIGLEEPEIALHPAAASVLLSALREGARHCQVLVTSHSPELLDNPDIPPESLLAVDNDDGLTRIGKIDKAGLELLRDRSFTPGELLRMGQLSPDPSVISDAKDDKQMLFDLGKR